MNKVRLQWDSVVKQITFVGVVVGEPRNLGILITLMISPFIHTLLGEFQIVSGSLSWMVKPENHYNDDLHQIACFLPCLYLYPANHIKPIIRLPAVNDGYHC